MLLFISIMAITSCGKKGCTNKYATNYCWKCKDDDGTCNYKSTMIFWFNKTTSDNLIADGFGYNGYYDIDVIVDYQYVGALNAGNYDTSEPNCNSNNISVTKEFSGASTKSFSLVIGGGSILNGTIQFSATNTCNSYQIIYP